MKTGTQLWLSFRDKLHEFNAWRAVEGNYIYLFRDILCRQGFWSTHNSKPPSKVAYVTARIVTAYGAYLTFIGFPMVAITSTGQPLQALLEPVTFAFISLMVLSNACCLLVRSDRLQECVRAYEEMVEVEKELPERPVEILTRRQRWGDAGFFAVAAAWSAMISGVFAAVPHLLTTRLIYSRIWFPYNVDADIVFELNLAVAAIFLCYTVVYFQTTSGFLGTLLIHVTSHLELLCHNFAILHESALRAASARLGDEPSTARGRGLPSEDDVIREMELVMRSCVRHHQAVIRLVLSHQDAFSSLITQYLVACLIPASLTIVTIQYAQEMSFSMLVELMVLCGLATGLLGLFYFTDKIASQSEAVREAVFGCDWLRASDGFKRSMRIIMSRSNQPLVIKVAGGIPLTLDTFQELMSRTYKFNRCVSDLRVSQEK